MKMQKLPKWLIDGFVGPVWLLLTAAVVFFGAGFAGKLVRLLVLRLF